MNRITVMEQRLLFLSLLILVPTYGYVMSMRRAPNISNVEDTFVSQNNNASESSERRLKRYLLRDYDVGSRPVKSDNDTVNLQVAITLFQLLDINEKQQTVTAAYSVRLTWVDQYLTWNRSDFGTDEINIPAKDIWQPDVTILNIADDSQSGKFDDRVIVSSEGNVLWMWLDIIQTTCSIDVRMYPFDEQDCKLVFMSWTYSGRKLNVTGNRRNKNAVFHSPHNQEWTVLQIEAVDNVNYYPCCPDDPYPDVTFSIHMHRRSLFYILNLVLPGFLIYSLAALGFLLSHQEKVNMQATVLLTLMVFLFSVSDRMPPTPDSIPVLSLFFLLILILVSIALSMSIIVSTLYWRPSDQPLPKWSQRFVKFMLGRKREVNCNGSLKLTTEAPRSQNERNANDTAKKMRDSVRSATGSFGSNCNGVHWKSFAEALDKFFLYLFLALSVVALLICTYITLQAFH